MWRTPHAVHSVDKCAICKMWWIIQCVQVCRVLCINKLVIHTTQTTQCVLNQRMSLPYPYRGPIYKIHTPGDIASEKRIQSYTLWYTKMFVWSIPRSGYLPTLHLSNCSASRIFSRRGPSNTTLIPDLVLCHFRDGAHKRLIKVSK